jgi:molybdopterin molybdotransferase
MIPVSEALAIIEANTSRMPIKKIKVSKSLGFVLAEAVFSPINMPPFRQSAMDGYAFLHSESNDFKVISEIQAGDFSKIKVKENQAVRIFTGAHVPDETDTVVMQEHTVAIAKNVEITKIPSRFANVRNIGEQIKQNELAIDKNTLINPACIGFLTSLGITKISVYAKPKVAIIVTGNELVPAGKKLPKGKIYESNSVMLEASLQQNGISKIKIFRTKDSLLATKKVIKKAFASSDIVLVSGGISVGDYDFVREALILNGVQELFYKINQKPGKPLFFGKKDDKLVFALPGNPASSLTCYAIYVQLALKKSMGFEAIHSTEIKRKINIDFENTTGKALFLKAFFDDEKVTVLESQSSAMLNTFAIANGLIFVPDSVSIVKKGDAVTVFPLN